MLVLSRKKDESIVINNDITIVVVEIRGDKVRLGVEAPKEVPVHRREVFEAIARGEPVDASAAGNAAASALANDVSVSSLDVSVSSLDVSVSSLDVSVSSLDAPSLPGDGAAGSAPVASGDRPHEA